MRGVIAVVTLVFAVTTAGENLGSKALQQASVEEFPFVAALLRAADLTNFQQRCGGSILNNRAVLTAGQCVHEEAANRWRFRVGSSSHSSGGTVYHVTQINENDFDEWSMGWDIAIVHTSTAIVLSANVQPGRFASASYILAENTPVTTVGWGRIRMPSWDPAQFEDLRKHQQSVLDNAVCREALVEYGLGIREAQLCSGFSNPDQVAAENADEKCVGEPGTPLVHNGNVVGIRSFAVGCGTAEMPTVSTRVSSYIAWISDNA